MKKARLIRVISVVFVVMFVIGPSVIPVDRHDRKESNSMDVNTEGIALAAGAPGNIGGGLRSLMRLREQGVAPFVPELRKILRLMDEAGGVNGVIWFDHKLSDGEINSLENGFRIKFNRVNGKIQTWSPVYSAIIPWNNVILVSQLPGVKQVESYAWPPPIPAMDSSIPAVKANLVWPLTDSQGRQTTGKVARAGVLMK